MKNLIANLPLRLKFLLLGVIAALMLLLPATLLVRADLGHVEAAQRQLEGIAPAQSAVALIHVTQQHRGISALVLGGDTAAAANRRAKQAEVDRGLAQLTKAVATLQDA
ncbi:MAG: methyl-accepting chemotaxis protein, partial [Phycisphaerae bacterium]|nr:methyl-accepting chemotaxis protein [Phycisphaerae bacterium]